MTREDEVEKSAAIQSRKRLGNPHAVGVDQECLPPNGIKGFSNFELEEERMRLTLVKYFRQVLHIKEIIMNASLFYECTSSWAANE